MDLGSPVHLRRTMGKGQASRTGACKVREAAKTEPQRVGAQEDKQAEPDTSLYGTQDSSSCAFYEETEDPHSAL